MSQKRMFVIQEHHAKRLHWDFRLEMDGVLKSWAIPKEPPKNIGIKRLAIQVENHPLSYAKFEGQIPKGEYGAGTIKIWDQGEYELFKEDDKKIEFKLIGKKMSGNYVLLKFKKPKDWLFFKLG